MDEMSPAENVMANALFRIAEQLIPDLIQTATALGTEIHLTQVIGAFLAVGSKYTSPLLTREEFLKIWDVFEELRPLMELEPKDMGSPGDVAHARSREEAEVMADYWDDKIMKAALGFVDDTNGMGD